MVLSLMSRWKTYPEKTVPSHTAYVLNNLCVVSVMKKYFLGYHDKFNIFFLPVYTIPLKLSAKIIADIYKTRW